MGRIINVQEIKTLGIDYFVYTDGACTHNGQPNAKAGYGIFFGIDDPRNVSVPVNGKQTNNVAEIQGVINTFPIIKKDVKKGKKICIVTDSKYVLKCIGTYGLKQELDNWEKNIPNKTLVQEVYNIYKNLENVYFMYIKAHTDSYDVHSVGNRYADELAVGGIGSRLREKCVNNTGTGKVKNVVKVYLHVPYVQKDIVKKLGGKWDVGRKQWYIMSDCPNIKLLVEKYGDK